MTPNITYVCPIIHDRYIGRLLYTLYKYSEPDSFRFILIDQVKDGVRPEVREYIKDKVHLYIHPSRNLGYAKACNEGIIHGIHWKTPYICCTNDDIEIMNRKWLQGIWDTFDMHDNIAAVVPMSPRVAGWGYGVVENPEVLPYKEEYTEEEYDFLVRGDFSLVPNLPKTMPKDQKGSIVDGAALIMPYFRREALLDVGMLDEHFFPGSGEDYDYNARAYKRGWRLVSTSLSWVWHHWTKSKDLFGSGELEDPYYKSRPYWNNMGDLWPPEWNEGHEHDVWGKYHSEDGTEKPLRRVDEVFVDMI
jgi:GT2 family glycosyltransferase